MTRTAILLTAFLLVACAGEVADNSSTWDLNTDPGDDAGHNTATDVDLNGDTADPDDTSPDQPLAPENLQATTDLSDHVRVTWNPVDNALAYELLRDGEVIAETADLEVLDEHASPPGTLLPPENFTATDHRGDGVFLSWNHTSPSPGDVHQYQVRALFADDPGPLSDPVNGHRSPFPYSFEIRRTSEDWLDVGPNTSFLDEEAPYGDLLDPGRTRATKGAHLDRVYLQIFDLESTPGPEVTYEVRVLDAHHGPILPQTTTGRRGPGIPPVQWERSPGGSPTGFVALSGATSAPYSDLSAPEDGTPRYWRARLTVPGESPQYSEPDLGYRAVDCIIDETFDGQVDFVNVAEELDIPFTTTPPTHDANLQALWDATLPAPNWEDPQTLSPAVQVNGAIVIATSFRENRQFWLQDSQTAFQVYLDDPLPVDVRVGQSVSFTATAIDVFNGNPEVVALDSFVINSEENPVFFRDLRTDPVSLTDHYYQLVRLGGGLSDGESCSGNYQCFDYTYGPTGASHTVPLRTSSQFAEDNACLTFFGPVIAFPGPFTTLPQEPAPQLQTDHHQWTRWQ